MKFKILFLSMILIFAPVVSSAQTVPFGGRITIGFPCTCSGGWYLMVYDLLIKTPVPMVFQFGVSRLNAQYNIFTNGNSLLGSYTPGGTCLIYSGNSCESIPVTGTITPPPLPGVGTSLSPL
jgi:hypothetical protein